MIPALENFSAMANEGTEKNCIEVLGENTAEDGRFSLVLKIPIVLHDRVGRPALK